MAKTNNYKGNKNTNKNKNKKTNTNKNRKRNKNTRRAAWVGSPIIADPFGETDSNALSTTYIRTKRELHPTAPLFSFYVSPDSTRPTVVIHLYDRIPVFRSECRALSFVYWNQNNTSHKKDPSRLIRYRTETSSSAYW